MDDVILQMMHISGHDARTAERPLTDVNLTLHRGEIHAVVSPISYEASAFIDILLYYPRNMSGDVLLVGETYNARRNNQIGFAVSSDFLFPAMTAAQNLLVKQAYVFHLSKRKADEYASTALEEYGVHLDLSVPVDRMSHEDRLMLSILRACMLQPSIIVLHDTLTQLGNDRTYEFLKILEKTTRKGIGIIYVTSKVDDALRIADTVSILNEGTIQSTQSAERIRRNPRSVLYLLSGWNSLFQRVDQEHNDFLNMLGNTKELMASGFELKNLLKYLAENIQKELGGSQSQIYLISSQTNAIVDHIDSCKGNEAAIRISPDFVLEWLHTNTLFTLDAGASTFPKGCKGIASIIGVPAKTVMNVDALILVFFERPYILSKKDGLFLNTVNKEIAIAIETNKLMGNSVLLQESHHRIKNSLQIIVNLLYLQKTRFLEEGDIDPRVESAFDMTIGRVRAVAGMHDLLAKSATGKASLSLNNIVQKVASIYQNDSITINSNINALEIPYNKAVSIAMIVNELVSNSIKHAFTAQSDHKITISCRSVDENIEICVRDNGMGYPEDFDPGSADSSIGMSIVSSITNSLRGSIRFYNDDGAVSVLSLPKNTVTAAEIL